MFRAFYVSVTIICATYYVQLELAYLVIEREMIKKEQESVQEIFQNQAEGVLVYH